MSVTRGKSGFGPRGEDNEAGLSRRQFCRNASVAVAGASVALTSCVRETEWAGEPRSTEDAGSEVDESPDAETWEPADASQAADGGQDSGEPTRDPLGAMQGTPYGFLNRMVADTGNQPEIYWVTNHNADGPGSLREGLSTGSDNVPRVILFAVNGEIDNNLDTTRRHDGHEHAVYENITFNRKNVIVAGQSCPPARAGVGRGVQIKGRFYTSAPKADHNIVFWHLRSHPLRGVITSSVNGEESWLINPKNDTGLRASRFAWLNCSAHGTMDEAFKLDDHSEGDNNLNGWAIVGCYFHGSNHYGLGSVLYGGVDPSTVDQYGRVGGYGPDMGAVNEGGLLHSNIFQSCNMRGPQIGYRFKGILANNYHFNFGHNAPGNLGTAGERKNCPVYVVISGNRITGQHQTGFFATASNVAEGGRRSNPWKWHGEYLGIRSAADDRVAWWTNGDDRVFTYFNEAGNDISGGNHLSSVNNDLRSTIQDEWYPATNPVYGTQRDGTPYALPEIILPSSQVKQNALEHAGAWPANRDSVDLDLIDEIRNRDADFLPGIPMPDVGDNTRLLSANLPRIASNGPLYPSGSGLTPSYPDDFPTDPFAAEANGLYALENWLWKRHVEAGGVLNYAAAEWFNRDWDRLWGP